MGMFREAKITWRGDEYTFTPDMLLLQRIESTGTGISLMHVSSMLAKGRPMHATMSMVVGVVLRGVGVAVSDEEICVEMSGINIVEAISTYNQIIDAINPEPQDEKKPDAQSE